MNALQAAISLILEDFKPDRLRQISAQITEKYRYGLSLSEEEELLTYLIVRMPATYAVLCRVFAEISPHNTLLDMGAGPATSYWAAHAVWEQPPQITAYERELGWINWGKRLGSEVAWKAGDILREAFDPHDWVLFSYSLGEIEEEKRLSLLEKSWKAAKIGLIVIEPGTPRGSQNVMQARSALLQLGAHIAAPCPHAQACPLQQPHWCHFSVRLERSFLHRLAKSALLPYEDEKFSYVILTKEPHPSSSRIIHTPLHRSGHTILSLCTPEGLRQLTISRRHKELYREAKKASWGDSFNRENWVDLDPA